MKPGRNDPCPCGSGRKYKHCHGAVGAAAAAAPGVNPHGLDALAAMIHSGRLDEAEERLQGLLRRRPADGTLWKFLSVALVRQGKEALPALRRAAELLPDDAEAHANLGAALHDSRQWEAALASLRRSLDLEPRNPGALVDAANALRALGRPREALPLYLASLPLDPRSAEAHNNLGNAYLELGQPAEAVDHYRRALGIKPHDAQIHCNLGSALWAQGQRPEAVVSYRQALALNPSFVEALNNLGAVLRELGERSEALVLYQQALDLDPQRPESHCNLGNVLFELRCIGDAEAAFRRALALQGDHPQARLGLATLLRLQGRHAEAEASCRAALSDSPKSAALLALLGELHADRGQFAEAQELFQRAIELDPGFASAYCGIAEHRRMTPADAAWRQGVEALVARPLPLGQEISLRYALGKYFDDLADYDAAFGEYRKANELSKHYGTRYEGSRLTRRVEAMIETFDAGFIRECHRHASASELPVFIVGMPRSGTSLTEQILASHAHVFGAGELRFWDGAYSALEKVGLKSADAAQLIPGIGRDYLGRLSALSPGSALRVIDKMPANFLYAGLIHAAFPRARIIHVHRHPIDTCLSIYFQNFLGMGPYANDFDNLAHYYSEFLRITAHWRALLPSGALLEIPYEGLIADQGGWTRRMLEFLGLPWDPECLEFHRTDRVVITASRWQVRQIIHASSVGRWRNYEKYIGPLRHLPDLVDREGHGLGRAGSP
jgi:tetratricopeptide (TPR) repeat protein